MTDTTLPTEPRRTRRPARSRRPINLRRRRRNRAVRPPLAAAEVLARLAVHGDVYKVGATPYFVAPIDDDMLDTVIAALGAAEDDEENGDMEPNTGDDEPSIGGYEDLELDEAERGEPELGWQNAYHGGSQLGIADECRDGPCYESDGDCDGEDGDPDHGVDDVPHDPEEVV